MAPISIACRRAPARVGTRPTIARSRRGRKRRSGMPRAAQSWRWSPAAIPASSPWRRPSARRSRTGPETWRAIDLAVVPGITAALAAAARVGAPLGDDFCVISLSDNLRPWLQVEERLRAAAGAGFVLALYNPASRARPSQLAAAFAALATVLPAETAMIFARAIGREGRARVGHHPRPCRQRVRRTWRPW